MINFRFGIWIACLLLSYNGIGQNKVQLPNLDLAAFSALIQDKDPRPRVINVWASWCSPCMEELPYFAELKKNHPEIRVILINLDFQKDVERKVIPILGDKYKACEIFRLQGLSADEWMPLLNQDWSGAIPATLIIKQAESSFTDGKFKSYQELNLKCITP